MAERELIPAVIFSNSADRTWRQYDSPQGLVWVNMIFSKPKNYDKWAPTLEPHEKVLVYKDGFRMCQESGLSSYLEFTEEIRRLRRWHP